MRSHFVKFGVARITKNSAIVNIVHKFWSFFYWNRMVCNKFTFRPTYFAFVLSFFQNLITPLTISHRCSWIVNASGYIFTPLTIAIKRAKTVLFDFGVRIKFFATLLANMKFRNSVRALYRRTLANFKRCHIKHVARFTTLCALFFFFATFTFVFSHFSVLSNNWVNSGKPVTGYAVGNPEPSLASNRFEGAQTKDDPTDGTITHIVVPVKENNSYKRPARKGTDSRIPLEIAGRLDNYVCIASVNAMRTIKDHSDFTEAAKYGDMGSPYKNWVNCWEALTLKSRVISSQALQGCNEGSETNANRPDRTMKRHERPTPLWRRYSPNCVETYRTAA